MVRSKVSSHPSQNRINSSTPPIVTLGIFGRSSQNQCHDLRLQHPAQGKTAGYLLWILEEIPAIVIGGIVLTGKEVRGRDTRREHTH